MTFVSGIQLVENESVVYKNFIRLGPLHRFPIVFSINRDKGTLRRWIVFSQGKRSTLTKYLFGKMLWDELSSFERSVFFSLPEVTNDFTIYLSLKALVLGTSKRDLRERLRTGNFLGFKYIPRAQYLSIQGRCDFFFKQEEINLRSVPKYSGYTKHYKDKGSLRPHVDTFVSESDPTFSDISEECLLNYLTVGKIPFFQGEGILTPKRPNKVETVNHMKIK